MKSHPRIHDPLFKLGQRVGLINPDCPMRVDPGYVIKIELNDNGKDYTYTIADYFDKMRGKFQGISDGWKESDLTWESSINSEVD